MTSQEQVPVELVERIRKASRKAEQATEEASRQIDERDLLLGVARNMGATIRSLAEITGLSPQRVHQITSGEPISLGRQLRESLLDLSLAVHEDSGDKITINAPGALRRATLSPGQARLLLLKAEDLRSHDELFGWIEKQGWRVERYPAPGPAQVSKR